MDYVYIPKSQNVGTGEIKLVWNFSDRIFIHVLRSVQLFWNQGCMTMCMCEGVTMCVRFFHLLCLKVLSLW